MDQFVTLRLIFKLFVKVMHTSIIKRTDPAAWWYNWLTCTCTWVGLLGRLSSLQPRYFLISFTRDHLSVFNSWYSMRSVANNWSSLRVLSNIRFIHKPFGICQEIFISCLCLDVYCVLQNLNGSRKIRFGQFFWKLFSRWAKKVPTRKMFYLFVGFTALQTSGLFKKQKNKICSYNNNYVTKD